MSVDIITEDDRPETLPERDFALGMGETTIFADSRTDLVAHLIEGYADALDGANAAEETAWMRHQLFVAMADQLAGSIFASAVNEGEIAMADLSEDELNTILPPDRRGSEPFTGTWDGPVPLILIRSDYAPHTRRELPEGNVHFLDPTTETTFLDSLVEAGMAELHVRDVDEEQDGGEEEP